MAEDLGQSLAGSLDAALLGNYNVAACEFNDPRRKEAAGREPVLTAANKQMRKHNSFYSSPADAGAARVAARPGSAGVVSLLSRLASCTVGCVTAWPFTHCVCVCGRGERAVGNLTKVGAKWKITFKNAITITNKDTKSKWQMGQSASLPASLSARLLQPEPEAERT